MVTFMRSSVPAGNVCRSGPWALHCERGPPSNQLGSALGNGSLPPTRSFVQVEADGNKADAGGVEAVFDGLVPALSRRTRTSSARRRYPARGLRDLEPFAGDPARRQLGRHRSGPGPHGDVHAVAIRPKGAQAEYDAVVALTKRSAAVDPFVTLIPPPPPGRFGCDLRPCLVVTHCGDIAPYEGSDHWLSDV